MFLKFVADKLFMDVFSQGGGFGNPGGTYFCGQGGHGQFGKQDMTHQSFEGFPSYDGQHQQQVRK